MGAMGWIRMAKKVLLQGVRLGTAIIMHSPDPPAVDVRRSVPNLERVASLQSRPRLPAAALLIAPWQSMLSTAACRPGVSDCGRIRPGLLCLVHRLFPLEIKRRTELKN